MRRWLLAAGGILLVASSFAHAFAGWPPQRAALEAAGVEVDLIGGLTVGWYFGSVAMFAFGAIALRDAWEVSRDGGARTGASALIGLAYLLFGARALFYRGFNPHFLGFIVIGLLVLIPALPGFWRRRA